MHGYFGRIALAGSLIMAAILACNMPSAAAVSTPDMAATWVAGTLAALTAAAPAVQPASTEAIASTPSPTDTVQPSLTPTPGNPVVIKDALCGVGPASNYEVVSAVKTGTKVELIGRGSIAGWYIINNPIYHDPCWIAAANLQIDPGFNVSALPVIIPPPSPTPKPTKTKVPTPTPV